MKYTDLNNLKEMVEGDKEFMISMIDSFIQKTPPVIQQLEKFAEEKNWDKLGAVAHKTLSSTTIFEIDELSAVLKTIEKDAKERKNLEQINQKIEIAKTLSEKAMEELTEEKQKLQQEIG